MVFLTIFVAVGCERRFDVEPTYATEESYRDQIDVDQLPAETREIYDRVIDGSLHWQGRMPVTFRNS